MTANGWCICGDAVHGWGECTCEPAEYVHAPGYTVPCQACEGSGFDLDDAPCGLCRGSGVERCEACGDPATVEGNPRRCDLCGVGTAA